MNEHDAIARIKRLSHNINCADEIWALTDEIAEVIERLINERDEARRMYCEAVNRHHVRLDAFGIAKNHGWDCYKDRADD